MKLTCDLCGGALQVNLGGQGATCTVCGLGHTMDRLREKLNGQSVRPEPSQPVVPTSIGMIDDMIDEGTVVEKPRTPRPCFDYVPKQFVLDNNAVYSGDFGGFIQQGGIGLGDKVYINGDYSKPYTIYSINDDCYTSCAKQGQTVQLFVDISPRERKLLKNARLVTGAPNPVANAYNYPGTVLEYFSRLLRATFSEYEIREDVSRNEISIPIRYLFCRYGKPVLALFLLDSNDSQSRYQVEKATRLLAPEGIVCTHFYDNYRNDAPYVIDRIRGALGR